MLAYAVAFAIGVTGGLRTFAPLFAVRFPFRDWTTLLAGLVLLGELVADKLPNVPARISPGPLFGRAAVSGYAAWAVAVPLGAHPVGAIALAVAGALAGAYLGYDWRVKRAPALRIPDLAAALLEGVVAVAGALWLVLAA